VLNDKEIPFFNLSISQITDVPDVRIFNSLEFLIQHISLKCDDVFITGLTNMFEQIMKIMDTNFTGINEIFVLDKNQEEQTQIQSLQLS